MSWPLPGQESQSKWSPETGFGPNCMGFHTFRLTEQWLCIGGRFAFESNCLRACWPIAPCSQSLVSPSATSLYTTSCGSKIGNDAFFASTWSPRLGSAQCRALAIDSLSAILPGYLCVCLCCLLFWVAALDMQHSLQHVHPLAKNVSCWQIWCWARTDLPH